MPGPRQVNAYGRPWPINQGSRHFEFAHYVLNLMLGGTASGWRATDPSSENCHIEVRDLDAGQIRMLWMLWRYYPKQRPGPMTSTSPLAVERCYSELQDWHNPLTWPQSYPSWCIA
jgi:hypothetical protein